MFDTISTIAAISTPAGQASRAIVRASGDRARQVAGAMLRTCEGPLTELGGFRTVSGVVRCGDVALPARAYVFRAPRSYTRQDVVELHVPGPPIAAGIVLEAMLAAGARLAEPGEFTRRAFFSGRIDLSAAEAVADVVAAATDSQLRAASANAGGALGAVCHRWRDGIANALVEVEASIDLAEEDIEPTSPGRLAERLNLLVGEIGGTLAQAMAVTGATDTPRVAIAGAPNVGKSSLLNALTGLDRAIVSATAGTTRDVLTAPMTLPSGGDVLLVDLAGFTGAAAGLAKAADGAAWAALDAAEAIVLVLDAVDANLDLLGEIIAHRPNAPLTVLVNKTDLLDAAKAEIAVAEATRHGRRPALAVSALTRTGLDEVKRHLDDVLHVEANRAVSPCSLHDHQRRSLDRACRALACAAEEIASLAHLADRAEIAAIELRTALAELGAISGEMATEELLARIFARFCVGK